MSPANLGVSQLWSAKDPEVVKRELHNRLPRKATVSDVKALSEAQNIECSEMISGVIRCSMPAPSELAFVRAKWLIEFFFEANELTNIEVKKGLIGP
jgi:hypothetical protein